MSTLLKYLVVVLFIAAWSLILLGVIAPMAEAHSSRCPTIQPPMTVKHKRATRHQRRMATTILNVGRAHHAKWKVHISAIMAATQESGLQNIPYGHGSSVGLFQLIDTHEPRAAGIQRLIPVWVAHWYYLRAINVAHHHPSYTPAQIAQAVERSGYPGAYSQWKGEAQRTWGRYVVACASR